MQYFCEISVVGGYFQYLVVYFDEIAPHPDCDHQGRCDGKYHGCPYC